MQELLGCQAESGVVLQQLPALAACSCLPGSESCTMCMPSSATKQRSIALVRMCMAL